MAPSFPHLGWDPGHQENHSQYDKSIHVVMSREQRCSSGDIWRSVEMSTEKQVGNRKDRTTVPIQEVRKLNSDMAV